MNKVQNSSIETLVGEVRNLLTQARQATARTINTAMVTTWRRECQAEWDRLKCCLCPEGQW